MRGWVCRLQLLLVLASTVILRSESHGTHDHILLSQIRDSPNLEGQVPVFISSRNLVPRLCPQSLGSLFVTSYNLQGYGGGIRPHLHTGYICIKKYKFSLYLFLSSCKGPNREHPKLQYYEIYCVLLSICTVAMAIEVICKYCGRVFGCDSNPHS
jgi:hypothetical protein